MESSVDPVFYFNVYSPVTSLSFCNTPSIYPEKEKTLLMIGNACGKILQWNIKSRKQENEVELSSEETNNPILWLCTLKHEDELLLAAQVRFSDIIYLLKYSDYSWIKLKKFHLPDKHVGFCRGDVGLDNILVFPSGENAFVMAKLRKDESGEELSFVSHIQETKGCGMITCLKYSLVDGKQCIFSLFENGDIYLHKAVRSSEKYVISLLCKYQCTTMTPLSIDFDSEKCRGVICGSEENLLSFELKANCDKLYFNLIKTRAIISKGISSVMIRPDKKVVVAGSWDSTVKMFSWLHPEKLKPLGALKFHSDGVEVVTSTTDSTLIAAGSKDGKISFWNIY